MSYNKKLLQQITERLNKPTRPNVPRNQWQHPGEITSIPSKNITMRGVTYPVLGVDPNGYAQMMQPGRDYRFTKGPVVEYPMMQKGGWLNNYAEGGDTPKPRPIWERAASALNPFNWGVKDYTDNYKNRNAAYAAARKAGEKEFMYNGVRYNTKYAGTPNQQLRETGITDDRLGVKNDRSEDAYRFVKPSVYDTKEDVAIQLENYRNRKDRFDDTERNRLMKEYTTEGKKDNYNIEKLRQLEKALEIYEPSFHGEDEPYSEDAWRIYLGLPQTKGSFSISKYQPTKAKDKNVNYYRLPSDFKDVLIDMYKNHGYKLPVTRGVKGAIKETYFGDTRDVEAARVLGNFTMNEGRDERGDYLSYYDIYDLNPNLPVVGKTFGLDNYVGKPFEIYDRVHIKDYGDGKKKRMYYTDQELMSLDPNKRNFDALALQRELANRGYKLPKSKRQLGPYETDYNDNFDGVFGNETKNALLDWQNKTRSMPKKSYGGIQKMQPGGERKFPKETLASRTKAYKTIRPSDYFEASNYARWIFNNEREEFDDPRSEEAFRLYLGLENNPKYFIPSKYRPTINPDPNGRTYYQVDPQLEQEIFNSFKDKVKLNQIKATSENSVDSDFDEDDPTVFKEGTSKYKELVPGDKNIIFGRPMVSNARALGNFVVSRGKDEKGEYLSYSDQYDFPDWAQYFMEGIPYKIYGRVYYPKKATGGQHGGLDRWFAEKWVDVKTGEECGRDEGEKRAGYPACRPSRRVNDDTPKTASELSSSEREKFVRSKTSSERINYQHRRKEYGGETNESDMANKPNNPSLWSKAKSLAKEKYDVYPSAYANGWAAKWYKNNGGTWRKAGYGMEVMNQGGTNNPGFEALPEYVQAKILANMGYGGMTYPFMQQGGEPDGAMALGQIDAAMDKLMKLRKFIQPDSDLEPWVSSKLTLLDHYTDAVSDYMQYNPEAQGGMMPEEEMMMEEGGGIPERYKNMGFSRVGQKKESTSEGKKWMVLAKKGDDYKVVHGGYDGMQDYTQHGSEERRENFWNRMGGRDSAKAQDPFSPLYWHKRFGTWESGGYVGYDGKRHVSKTPTWSGLAGYAEGGDYVEGPGPGDTTIVSKPTFDTVEGSAIGTRFRDMLNTTENPKRPRVIVAPTDTGRRAPVVVATPQQAPPVAVPVTGAFSSQDSALMNIMDQDLAVYDDSTVAASNPYFIANDGVSSGQGIGYLLGAGALTAAGYKLAKRYNKDNPKLDPNKLADFQQIIKNRGYRAADDFDKLKNLGLTPDQANDFLKGMSFDKNKPVQVAKPPAFKPNILTQSIDESTWKSLGFDNIADADKWINQLPDNVKAQFMQLRKTNPGEIKKEVGAMLQKEREDRIVQQGIEQARRAQAIERGKKGREAALQNAANRPAESPDAVRKNEYRERVIKEQTDKVRLLEKDLESRRPGTKGHTDIKNQLTQARRNLTRVKNLQNNVAAVAATPMGTPVIAPPSVVSMGTPTVGPLPPAPAAPYGPGIAPIELVVDLGDDARSAGNVAREASMLDDFRNSGFAGALREGMQMARDSKTLGKLAKFFKIKEDGGEYYPMMQYQTKGQVKEEDIDWYNEMVKIIDPTGISSYGDAYETFHDPNADYWDKLGAGLSVLPMVGKVGKLGKVLKLSKAAPSKLSKAWNASRKFVGKGLDMVDNVVSYPARQMDEYSPIHRMYNKATGEMIERTNPNRFVRGAANLSSLNNLGNRGANAYGLMWDGTAELLGMNDPRYAPKKKMGGIHIDPSKKGTFKAQASKMGMGVQQAAAAILRAPEGKYSPEMRKKANFARNFAKQDGGPVVGDELDVTPEQLEVLRQMGYEFEIV